jgi:hypothetical protein
MNLSRGLFRAWIVLSILWTLGTVALAASLLPDKVRSDRYQYVYARFPLGRSHDVQEEQTMATQTETSEMTGKPLIESDRVDHGL